MYHVYANSNPRLNRYYRRASDWRSRFMGLLVRRAARAAGRHWARVLCRRKLRRAIFELNGLSDAALKDIGIARGEIGSKVIAAQKPPCRQRPSRNRGARSHRPSPAAQTPRYVSGWKSGPAQAASVLSP